MSDNNDIVGHKTKWDAERQEFYHEPLSRAEADVLIESIRNADAKREALMPDEDAAIQMLFDAVIRLKDFGWKNAMYCRKDGTEFLALEAGSTGKHRCIYKGEWPTGSYWIIGGGDMRPSRPVLIKETP